MFIFGANIYIIISMLTIAAILVRQYKNKSPALIFSTLFLFYVVLPLSIPINFISLDNEIYESASKYVFLFSFGYSLAQFIRVGKRLDLLRNLNIGIFKARKLFLIVFYCLATYIITIVLYSGFDREISSLFFDNRIQISFVFLIAITLWTTKNKIELRFLYIVITAVGLVMFYSGSRIYIVPAILFLVLFYINDNKKKSTYIFPAFLVILILFTSLFRSYEGELFSFRSFVTILGEFYYTNFSFLIVLDKKLQFQHDFWDALSVILFPYLFPNTEINSDKFINQYTYLDFGLASSLLSDVALYTTEAEIVYIISGLCIGIIYKIIAEKFYGVSHLFSLVFISFTPILFRSGYLYLFALIKSISMYVVIIIFISTIAKFENNYKK